MFPIIWDFGPIQLRSYGLMLAFAFAAGILLAVKRGQKVGFSSDLILDLSVYILISSIIGARFFFVIMEWEHYLHSPLEIFQVWKGGLAVLGGIIAAVIVSFFYLRITKNSFLTMADIMVPSVALGQAIGRFGCYLNGCCFGFETHLPWGVNFTTQCAAGQVFPNVTIHPTQIYSMLLNLLVMASLLYFDRRKPAVGMTFFLYFMLLGLVRFFIDFLRYYDEGFIFHTFGNWRMTTPQVTSLFLFGFGLIFFVKFWVDHRKSVQTAAVSERPVI